MRQSLQLKLILVFGLVVLLPLVVMGRLYFDTLYMTLVSSAERELQVGVEQTALRLDGFFTETSINLRSQAQLPEFPSYVDGDEKYRKQAEPYLSVLSRALGRATNQAYVQSYLLIDRQGRIIYDQTQLDFGRDVSGEAFFQKTWQSGENQIFFTEPDARGQRSIYFSVPVWGEGGEKIGVLALRYNLNVVQLLAGQSTEMAGQGSFAILVDDDGRVLSWNQEIIPNLDHFDLKLLDDSQPTLRVNLEGQTYALAHQHLEAAPLYVLYVQPAVAIEAYVLSHVSLVLLVSFGVLVVTLFVALLAANLVSQPINQLTATAQRLMSGDWNARVTVKSSDEIGLLARTFNQMAAGLQEELQEIRDAEERYRQLSLSLEQKVEQRTEQLQIANQELESFSYSVSHDLRAPLRAINGFTRLLQESANNLDDESRGHLARIRTSAEQMGLLIDGLLALSRLGRQALRIQPLSAEQITELVNSILDETRASAPERLVEWKLGELPPCAADYTLLRQVFINLIGNAFKYTRGCEPAQIEIGFSQGAYFIRDNGVGFDMRYADKLFGVFQRLHRAEEFEGTGIGLVTVKRVIERHGGRIWAEGKVGQGATFYFTLPSATDHVDSLDGGFAL